MIYDTPIKSVLQGMGDGHLCRDKDIQSPGFVYTFTRILSAFAPVLVVFAHVLDNRS